MTTMAKNLRKLRKAAGLTQPELARRAGVSQQLISQIERGINRTTKELPQIASALGVQVHAIDESFILPLVAPAPEDRTRLEAAIAQLLTLSGERQETVVRVIESLSSDKSHE
jgi:transcriptional regulator with XRE-family HTH domain